MYTSFEELLLLVQISHSTKHLPRLAGKTCTRLRNICQFARLSQTFVHPTTILDITRIVHCWQVVVVQRWRWRRKIHFLLSLLYIEVIEIFSLKLSVYIFHFSLSFAIFGRRDEVKFYKVDKRFWRANLGQNWRLRSRSTENDLGHKVDIEDGALCRISHLLTFTGLDVFKVDKENSDYKVNIAKIINVDINKVVKICWAKAQSSMSTFRPELFSLNLKSDFCVDLLNFDLNDFTRKFLFKIRK